ISFGLAYPPTRWKSYAPHCSLAASRRSAQWHQREARSSDLCAACDFSVNTLVGTFNTKLGDSYSMQMNRSEFWKNFRLGEELDVSGTFIYNGLRRFHELRKLDYSADLFEVLYQLS